MRVYNQESYWLTRKLYLQGLGFIYAIIGIMLFMQGAALIGPSGLTPVEGRTAALINSYGGLWSLFWKFPSLLYFFHSDLNLYAMSAAVIACSLVLLSGRANLIVLFTLWVIQLSLVNGAGRFWGFGWETMMLEMTFLAFFMVHPWRWGLFTKNHLVPSYLMFLPLLWMLFRLLLGAGLIKVRGDACWLDLTCMAVHYETQPNPHGLSRFYHYLPLWFHKFEVVMTHFYELLIPLCFLLIRPLRLFAGIFSIAFQLILISTGNLAFLNWQTIVLCLVAFDDRFLLRWLPWFDSQTLKSVRQLKPSSRQIVFSGAVIILIFVLSYPSVKNMLQPNQRMNQSYNNLHLVNSYGLFGSITKKRYEVIISGAQDLAAAQKGEWQEYEFHCKPGDIRRQPCWITPYHLRLDWQMWFSAMRPRISEPWLVELARMMLTNDPHLKTLMAHNPFQEGEAPEYLKMDLYHYQFAEPDDGSGHWWQRGFVQSYMPPITLDSIKNQK